MFFSKIFHRCYSAIANWVREGLGRYAVGNTAFRDWSCCFLLLEEYSQVKLEGTAQCSFGSQSVISGELQKILTRPNVEVKFSNNVALK